VRVATYNVNSIRQRLPIVLEWLQKHQPDVMCLQETKVQDQEFPADALREGGYQVIFRGMKTFNGVATLTRAIPERVLHGLHEGPDNEDCRVLLTVVNGIPIVNSYAPQGHNINTDKYTFKLAWFRRIRRFFEEQLDPAKPAIWLGDLNVAPEPIDVYHPDRRVNDPDFHIDARNAFKEALSWGWVDLFRKFHPDRVQYTYWDYYRNALKNDWGWRIDHILVTAPLAERCRQIEIDIEPRHQLRTSDHTVVWADFGDAV
jgi:exodeoxyribonuclease-3